MKADPLVIYIIAGEPSGDMLGAALMAALHRQTQGRVRFAGIGGEAMQAQGLDSLFPMAELSIMGLAEVLPRIPKILKRASQTLDHIGRENPAAIITIDSWGFCGRIQKQAKIRFPKIKRIHYVAPMVWVWKSGRTKTLAKVLDLLMTLLPFEPPWFEKEGLKTVCVGHSLVESAAGQGDAVAFRQRHAIAADATILTVLPGSRLTETSRLLPIFERTVRALALRIANLHVVIPTVTGVAEHVDRAVSHWPVPVTVTLGAQDKYDGFAAARVALAASGTVSLELAMARLPMVVAYRVSPLTAFIATRFLGLKVRFASLLNILSDRLVIPEFLQNACTAENLTEALVELFQDGPQRQTQLQGLDHTIELLGGGQISPSLRAAQAVLAMIGKETS